MYRLVHSPHATVLCGHLAGNVRERQARHPLRPLEILVPNRDTARWLTLELARRNGAAANLRFLLPSQWVWKLIRTLEPDLPDLLPSDPGPLSWAICEQLGEPEVLRRCGPLHEWVRKQQSVGADEAVWAISHSMASLFDQYMVYRPRMMTDWENGEVNGATERWQAGLWQSLCEKWRRLPGVSPHRARLLLELPERIVSGRMVTEGPLLLFNPGLLPPPVTDALHAVSSVGEVIHYRITSSRTLMNDEDAGENELVSFLGDEQKARVRETRRRSEKDSHEEKWLDPPRPGDHLLGAIQQSILDDRPAERTGEPEDGSVVIRSCYNERREVEALYRFLLRRFEEDPDLKPDQIAIVTPDPRPYRAVVESVFLHPEEGRPVIPLQTAGRRQLSADRVSAAFLHLLELPGSRLTREDLISFAAHDAVSDRFGLTREQIPILERWFRENRITWGLNTSDRERHGQPARARGTWSHALERGWLGQLSAHRAGELSGGTLLYTGIRSGDEKEVWARFSHLFREVEQFVTACHRKRPADEWHRLLRRAVTIFISGKGDYGAERSRLNEAVELLFSEMDTAGIARDRIWSWGLISARLKRMLEDSSAGTARFTGGAVLHSMVPLRSLPFRIIAVLGLGEDRFPRKPERVAHDLMELNRSPGERDQRREDRNLFLESVMAASDIHYSSYIGRSQKDDETLPPSMILQEWIRRVADASGLDRTRVVEQQPLNGFSDGEFDGKGEQSCSAVYERVRRSLKRPDARSGFYRTVPDESAATEPESGEMIAGAGGAPEASSNESGQVAGGSEGSKSTAAGSPVTGDLPDIGRLEELEGFYRQPTRAFLRHRLNLRLSEFREEESGEFSVDGLDRYLLYRKLFDWTLRGWRDEQMKVMARESGWVPDGWNGERMIVDMMQKVRSQIDELGRQWRLELTPMDLEVKLDQRRIRGRVWSYSPDGFVDLHPSRLSGKWLLLSWLRHLFLASADRLDPDTDSVVYSGLLSGRNTSPDRMVLPQLQDPASCLAILVRLCRRGLKQPLNLYVQSAYTYAVQRYFHEKSPEKALVEAQSTWEGGYMKRAERDESAIRLLWGEAAPMDSAEVERWARTLYRPILKPGDG